MAEEVVVWTSKGAYGTYDTKENGMFAELFNGLGAVFKNCEPDRKADGAGENLSFFTLSLSISSDDPVLAETLINISERKD